MRLFGFCAEKSHKSIMEGKRLRKRLRIYTIVL